jgi:hypothetical protein
MEICFKVQVRALSRRLRNQGSDKLKNNPNGLSHLHLVGMDADKLVIPIMHNVSLVSVRYRIRFWR